MPSSERMDVVTAAYAQRRRRIWGGVWFLLALLLIGIFWYYLRPVPVDYASDQEHFKYGSIGSDSYDGIPLAVWRILPETFPEYLPGEGEDFIRAQAELQKTATANSNFASTLKKTRRVPYHISGYSQFGFLFETGRELPVGFSQRRVYVDRVGLNCAVCHTSTIRVENQEQAELIYGTGTKPVYIGDQEDYRVLVLGMPAHTMDLEAYFTFLFRCAEDGRFTSDVLLAAIDRAANAGRVPKLSLVERAIISRSIVSLRDTLLTRRKQLHYLALLPHAPGEIVSPRFGPGRVDTFSPYKSIQFGFPPDGTFGVSDYPSIWNQRPREGMHLHWDGNNQSVFERNISASLGAGTTPVALDMNRMRREDGRLTVTEPVVGGPAIRFNPQAYLAFLAACANDPRFNADTLMAAIDYNTKMSLSDKLLYRHFLIPGTKKAIQEQSADAAWMRTKPLWGPGRIDPFNPVKFDMLGMQPDGTVGNSDMMPLWELGAVNRPAFHTDGLSQNLLDCSLAGALGDGATRKSLPVGHIREIVDSFKSMKAPSLTAIAKSDGLLFKKGQTLFAQHCAQCHEAGGKYTFRSIRQSDDESETIIDDRPPTIATDRHRLEMWNAPNEDGRSPFEIYNDFGNGYPWDLNTFQKTDGYLALPLTGLIWRAPYLHNGSVPTLVDLLNEPMPIETVRNLMEQAQPGSYERLLKQFSTAGGPSFSRTQIVSGLAPLKPAVDRLIEGARLLQKRPPMFYRGSDELDLRHGGFAHTSDSLHPSSIAVPYITFIKGNSNAGHLYGTQLSDDEKRALIEYLKTL